MPTPKKKNRPAASERHDLTTVEGTRAAEQEWAAKDAAAEGRRAVIAKQIAGLLAEYDAETNLYSVREDVSNMLGSTEKNIIEATGLLGIARHDDCGPGEDDLDAAMRQLALARGALIATRSRLEDAGVFAAVAS